MPIDPFWGHAIGAASNLAAGLLSKKGNQSGYHEDDWIMWDRNYNLQKEFAQNGIRWKMDDMMAAGKKHGIHPLTMMGVQGQAGQGIPVQSTKAPQGKDMSWLARMGQDISMAIRSMQTDQEKKILDLREQILELRKTGLENFNRNKEKLLNQTNLPDTSIPSFTEEYLPDDEFLARQRGLYETQPVAQSWAPGVQKGLAPEGQYRHSRQGFIKYYPNEDTMDLISESIPASFSWWSDMATYKWAMTKGKINPNGKYGSYYKSELARLNKWAGEPVVWSESMRWRLKRYEPEIKKPYSQYLDRRNNRKTVRKQKTGGGSAW